MLCEPCRTTPHFWHTSRVAGRTALIVVFSIFLLMGLGFIGAAVKQRYEYRDAVHTEGTIVDLEKRVSTDDDGDRNVSYAPVIEFTDDSGATHRFTASVAQNPPPEVGSVTPVKYKPGDPASARRATFTSDWFFAIIGGAFTVAFAMALIITRIVYHRRNVASPALHSPDSFGPPPGGPFLQR